MKAVLVFIFAVLILTGCTSERQALVSEQTAYENLLKRTDRLYKVYFDGGRENARRSLQEIISLVENAKLAAQVQNGRAGVLFLAYGRLYALDHRAGSSNSAQIDLVNARYWCLRQYELDGDPPEGSAAYLAKFAGTDTLVGFIDGFDRGANNGELPRYVRSP